MDICELSAIELGAALRRRELSAVDALDAVLQRADEIDGTVNPFSMRLEDRARLAAHAADAALARRSRRTKPGPLCGIPVTTKDSHSVDGVASTAGSRSRRVRAERDGRRNPTAGGRRSGDLRSDAHLDWAPLLDDANLAGLPACALPIGVGDDGLPVSLQVLGRRCNDAHVLAAAETVETLIGFDQWIRP